MPKYPDITVKLLGEDGNAFSIIGRCLMTMRMTGLPKETMNEFRKEATSGDYDHLLQTVMNWFEVE